MSEMHQETLGGDILAVLYRDAVSNLKRKREHHTTLKAATKHAAEEEKAAQAALERLLGPEDLQQMSFTDGDEIALGTLADTSEGGEDDEGEGDTLVFDATFAREAQDQANGQGEGEPATISGMVLVPDLEGAEFAVRAQATDEEPTPAGRPRRPRR